MERVIFIASDHAGFDLKQDLVPWLKNQFPQFKIEDLGTSSRDSVDYPDFASRLAMSLQSATEAFGILICGSGQGMAMRANKYPWIRAALVYSSEIAELSREHNDANVICLGARFCTLTNAQDWIEKFMTKPFAGGRHATRVAKLTSSI